MNSIDQPQLSKQFIGIAKYCSWIVIGISLFALVGWAFDISAFKIVLPGFQPIKANTAFAFFMAGIALWLSCKVGAKLVTSRVVQICNGVVFLIGLLTLSEYIFSLNLGIDQLLFKDVESSLGSFPGRMAFASAVCMTLIGFASIFIYKGRGKGIDLGQYLSVIVLAISVLALVGYIYDVQALYKLDQFSSMSLHTAVGFALLAFGNLSVRPNQGWMQTLATETAGSVILRRVLPVLFGIPIFFGWLIVLGDQAGLYEAHFGLAMLAVLTGGFLIITLWLNGRQLNLIDLNRKQAEDELRQLNIELEQRVADRTAELKKMNERIQIELLQREQLSEALMTERDLLQTLMDNIPDTIYFKDTASRFTRINRAQANVLGIDTPEDAIGKTDADFFEPNELAKGFYEEEQQIVKSGKALTNRIEFNPTQDGQARWFSATKVPIKDENGTVIGIVGVSRDTTQQKQSEETLRQSEERFRLMSWATKDALWDWDLRNKQILWGEGLQKMFRYPSETQQTEPEWKHAHIHPQDREKVDRSMNQALEGGMEFWSKEYRFQRFDETYADVMDRGYILRDDKGTPYRIIGAMMDITERRQAEATILHQNEMLSSLHQITLDLLRYRELNSLLHALVELVAKFLDASYAEIMMVDEEMLVIQAATQYPPHLIGERLERDDAVLSWKAMDTREPAVLSDYEKWPHRRTVYDEFRLHAVAAFPILNDNDCLGVLALGRNQAGYEFTHDQIQYGRLFANITALVLNNAQLRDTLHEQSIRDGLTGLYNRRYMEETLKQQLSRATRQLHPLGIIMLDIDHFKSINDIHGHATGDELLRELGKLLKNNIRNEDIACRYGGEEFLLIMPDTSLETAVQRAELLRQSAHGLRVQEGQLLEGITLSLGVAVYPQHGSTTESVLNAADAALYRAKQEGRDRVVMADRD